VVAGVGLRWQTPGMTSDPKDDLHRYLRRAREALLWKLEGLSEYDARRPMTPTGTNLLGLVKHMSGNEAGYFGETFGRPFPDQPAWMTDMSEPNIDMWAAADETREQIIGLYQRASAHADETISSLTLESIGHVPWWPADRNAVTLHRILVHMTTETNRHAGHADIVRELIDGAAGLMKANDNMGSQDPQWWTQYRERLESVARAADKS
jgi:uncharacterized damage-inducible protein DinB